MEFKSGAANEIDFGSRNLFSLFESYKLINDQGGINAKRFISWSGAKSHVIANTLYTWLPVVLQSVRPFMSSEDLKKGGRWQADLTEELAKDSFGILCLTPSNLLAPWILFEAGALSKSVGDAQVAPFLVGVKPSELPPPLTQFNAVAAEIGDFKRLLRDINARVGNDAVPVERVEKSVDGLWPKIEQELKGGLEEINKAPAVKGSAGSLEVFDAILQELLVLNRNQSKLLSKPEELLPSAYLERVLADGRGLPDRNHKVWDDLFECALEVGDVSQAHPELAELTPAAERLRMITNYLGERYKLGRRRRLWSRNAARDRQLDTRKDLEGPTMEDS
ncbi:toll/interleukin-1 receptor domain-containing protein [Mesorhizobium sp. CA6]|uniref:TIR domain-containing protein n=1 Tax=Mesorhizobium sp. CA6 TaxID=588500 RepID=UPI001CCD07C2|nr:TIR domain-containing protein [Mesorhizobium sp. CA6]MBZ9769874.1 toll/interleukin-1 receptor domain-containing protein [Mesorhizobium sp. CA6]